MPTPRILPPTEDLAKLLDDGLSYREIADFVTEQTGKAVSVQAVNTAVHRAGLAGRRPRYDEWLPWKVPAKFSKQYAATMLRAYGRYLAANRDPADLGPELYHRLCNWLAMLEDEGKVVDFRPDEGFVYVKRRAGEEIIRRPKQPRVARTRAVS